MCNGLSIINEQYFGYGIQYPCGLQKRFYGNAIVPHENIQQPLQGLLDIIRYMVYCCCSCSVGCTAMTYIACLCRQLLVSCEIVVRVLLPLNTTRRNRGTKHENQSTSEDGILYVSRLLSTA